MIIKNIPLTHLKSHPLNNKIYQGNMNIDDLADNISKVGLLEPLVVIPSGTRNSYYVVSGNRRLLALNSLGFKKIDVNKIDIDKKGYSLGMSVNGYDTNSNYTKAVIQEFNRISKG